MHFNDHHKNTDKIRALSATEAVPVTEAKVEKQKKGSLVLNRDLPVLKK